MAWHNVDAKSMLLAVWMGCSFLLAELLQNVGRRLCPTSKGALQKTITPLSWLVPISVYWWLAETNATWHDQRERGSFFPLGHPVPPVHAEGPAPVRQCDVLTRRFPTPRSDPSSPSAFASFAPAAISVCPSSAHHHRV